jgi:GMP synthase (glutamine-hydrolysing)
LDSESLYGVKGIILSGGPSSVIGDDAPPFDERWFNVSVPILGVCYGMQLMGKYYGGRLAQGKTREYGSALLTVTRNKGIFGWIEKPNTEVPVWMSHGDHVVALSEEFEVLASSRDLPIAAFGDDFRKRYGIQFHPEVAHTPQGKQFLTEFLFSICGCSGDWDAAHFIEESVQKIRSLVPEGSEVVCGLSGGVDSTVAAVLVHRAIGKRLHCLVVDNGVMRRDEATQVVEALGTNGLGLQVHHIDASETFLKELRGVKDPESKRKIIGRIFIEVFEAQAKRFTSVTHLVQGTLYPDVIESVSVKGPSATIKTHHNVGGLPERMHLSLIEPLRELFKDEVRAFGEVLGIPESLLWRQPFPGPGLAVRIVGEITDERIDKVRAADAIVQEEMEKAGLLKSVWQNFAVLLPVRSVGVMGDARTYDEAIALRMVDSSDGMTADWFYPPEKVLRIISTRITNEVRGVNRVVLDVSSKPPATIEWE